MNVILLIMTLTSISLSILGLFLIFRNMSMTADAISHTVLLGIVIGFLFVRDINSPILVIFAAIMGLIMVFITQKLSEKKLMKNDDALGFIFPLFFSIAVIIISKYLRNVHIDTEIVLSGEVVFAPFDTIEIFNFEIPKALLTSIIAIVLNVLFIAIFYKELVIATFDENFAKLSNIKTSALFYALMALISLNTVIAFDTVGAILVVSFLIVPAASGYLLTQKLKNTFILTIIIAIIDSFLGYFLAYKFNLSVSGVTAGISGIIFLICLLFNREGIFTKIYNTHVLKRQINLFLVLVHVDNHKNSIDRFEELGLNTIYKHLSIKKDVLDHILKKLIDKEFIKVNEKDQIFEITDDGEIFCERMKKKFI
ncbi:MAG: metal ABC transporter permease [Tissierellia bacterium]|nr:metal ABC transporter permease [Tissierellia bacterium]